MTFEEMDSAHKEARGLPVGAITEKLAEIIGRKLTAYVGGVRDVRAVNRWIGGSEVPGEAEARLRFAYQVAKMLAEHDDSSVVQAWLIGSNPELGDRVPLRLMREGELGAVASEIIRAARAFQVGS